MANQSKGLISFNTAIALVVANMIGAGVFTSLGFQLFGFQAIFPLLMLWIVGGIVALCGALSYGELAALMPRSGGEYHFLSKIYHPAFGFLSGWISATVGFAAPIALAAMALGQYSSNVIPIPAKVIAISVVLLITIIHATSVQAGSIFQQYSTALKVSLILIFILGGLFLTVEPQKISVMPLAGDWGHILSPAFASSLAYVSFSYSGWNASAYLTSEIENPKVNVPKSLFWGTFIVMMIYVSLNFVFLYTASTESMKGQLEVGYISATVFLGPIGGKVMAGMIALLLISSISAMVFAGPRVTQVMGEDLTLLKPLAYKNANGVPLYAILLQTSISIILILTASFQTVLNAIAFTLDIFTFSTVLGVFVMRFRQPNAERVYKTWGYPITPLIFLIATAWTMYFIFNLYPMPSLIAIGVVLLGLVIYFADQILNPSKK